MGRSDRNPGWSEGGASGWTAFESFSAAAHVLSGDGLIVEANPAFERMFGNSRRAFYGLHQSDLCAGTHSARRRRTNRILREASSRGTWEGIIENRGSDGRRFTTQAHLYPTVVDGRRHFVCIQEESGTLAPARGFDAEASRWRGSAAAPG